MRFFSGPFTLFAPSDEAFNELDMKLKTKVLNDTLLLRKVLLVHLVPGNIFFPNLINGQETTSIEGSPLKFSVGRGGVTVNGSRIIRADVPASNGLIHIVDTVLLPEIVSISLH